MDEKNLQDLAATLDGRELTDDKGQLSDEPTSAEDTADLENENTIDMSDEGENPEIDDVESTQDDNDDDEKNLSDNTSDERIPVDRFNKVYAKLKDTERELENYRSASSQPREPQRSNIPLPVTDQLEMEMLFDKFPELNPKSESYDPELDDMGGMIYRQSPGITRIEAARQALAKRDRILQKVKSQQVSQRNRELKQQQSDSVARRSSQPRQTPAFDPDKASLDEMESWLKDQGAW